MFCQPVFQFLNSMPPIILLFPLLNNNQILKQWETSFGVADATGKHRYVLNFIENNPHYRLTK